ncbi:MAG: RIO1 family regulatory kinase/ATPase [Candidatus Woesearchaeota archaeon]
MIWKEEWKIYKNVFSQSSIKALEKLSDQGFFIKLKSPISIGKESNIFSAETADSDIIAKIFRLENAEFNRMRDYLVADPRYTVVKTGKRPVIFSWTQREFRNLLIARECIKVPTPIAFKENIILMELIGSFGKPAPMLKDGYPENPEKFFNEIVSMIKKLWKHGWVHGDLSGFNILNHEERPVFIDLSQMTSVKSPRASELLQRDVENICKFFRKDIKRDPSGILESIRLCK